MKDYYEILEVTPFSTISEIKHSFRKKAKLLHPDLVPDDDVSSRNLQMAELLKAYKYLLKKHKSFVEIGVFKNRKIKEFNYRAWLLERSDYKSRAKLIVFDLFHHREKTAIKEYLRLLDLELPFYFSKYFSNCDFMDYGFVLAEELFFEKHYYEAFMILQEIFVLEEEKPYFTHFFPEVIKLAKKCLEGLKYSKDYSKVMSCYRIAMNLQFTPNQKQSFAKHLRKFSSVF